MKKTTQFFLLVFTLVSFTCQAQVFTVNEFANLAALNQADLNEALEKRGYTFSHSVTGDLAVDKLYTGSGNMIVSVTIPNYKNGQNLISWQFVGLNDVYRDLKEQLISLGYDRFDREVRDGARYQSDTYSVPGALITLSSDKVSNARGVYTLSARFNKVDYSRSSK